jgi:peptidoglycan/LPS O-acetylase OafA/YrhL
VPHEEGLTASAERHSQVSRTTNDPEGSAASPPLTVFGAPLAGSSGEPRAQSAGRGSGAGVAVFFVVSGFLLFRPFARVLARRGAAFSDELRNHDLTFSGTSGFFVSAFFLLALTASASALTYLYVERPALRRKTARRSRARLGSSGALAEVPIRVR